MDIKKEIYLIITEDQDPSLSFGEAIHTTCATASNFKKAYEAAITMSGIQNPAPGYRSALERVNNSLAVEIKEKFGTVKTTIARIKKY